MKVLIVESKKELGQIWAAHLRRSGAHVKLVTDQEQACRQIAQDPPDVIVLDLVLENGSALAIADFANYREPDARIIFVTDTTFFSDGSIFNLSSNACAFVQSATSPDDLAALVEYHAKAG